MRIVATLRNDESFPEEKKKLIKLLRENYTLDFVQEMEGQVRNSNELKKISITTAPE